MLGILINWLAPFRAVGIWIDQIAFSLIDNAYNLIVTFSSGTLLKQEFISHFTKNLYVIIGIFALFKMALLLINSILNPDKLIEKGNGVSKVFVNFFVMFVLLIMTPLIFNEAINLQKVIIEGNYIQKIFTNTNGLKGKNPGKVMQNISLNSLITLNEEAVESNNCKDKCKQAIEDYHTMEKKGFDFHVLFKNMQIAIKNDDGETIYVYNYMFLVTFAVGIFITYILLSFAIDIAVRMVEMTVLQIISPLFIATYIDPKSSKDGPFKKWLTTCGKTYASLFIKIAIVSVMLLLISILGNLDIYAADLNLGTFEKLILLIAILIFAKKAPKWIGDMIGVEGAGLGGLGIGKKLGGAALLGGAVGKTLDSAKKFTGQKAKNFAANRLRNTAARVGGMKEQHKLNKANPNQKQSLWKAGKATAKQSRADNWGKDAQGVLKDLGAGYMAGRLHLNKEAKSINDNLKEKAQSKAVKANENIENTDYKRAKALEISANNKEAKKMYTNDVVDSKTGDRKKLSTGEYLYPRGSKEMNETFGNPISEAKAYEAFGKKLAQDRGLSIVNGKVEDSNGKILANSVEEFGASNMTYQGKLAVKQLVADNVKNDFDHYQNSIIKSNEANSSYIQAVSQLSEMESRIQNNNPEYNNAQAIIKNYSEIEEKRNKAKEDYSSILNNSDYQMLSNNSNNLNEFEQNRLASYTTKLKTINETVNVCNSKLTSEKAKYNEACITSNSIENSFGIQEMKDNVEKSRKQLEEWKKETEKYEAKFKSAEKDPYIAFDDEGNIKYENGKVVYENPYTVKVNGEKLNPLKDITRFEEIGVAMSNKASKAKSKFDDSMKESSADK